MTEEQSLGTSPVGDRAVVNGAGQAVSAVPASVPSAGDPFAWDDGVSWHKPAHRAVMASIRLSAWMSAALDDPNVCDAMKADINEWFSAGEPMELLCQALSPPPGAWSYYHDAYYGLWNVKAENQPGDERDVASFCTLEHAKLICRAVNAQGIEAPSGGETGTGSTVGESPVGETDAPESNRHD